MDLISRRPGRHRASTLLSLLFVPLLAPPPLVADDWPQFRGPQRDGRSYEPGLLRAWPATGPRALWRAPLGDGYSGVVAVGDGVFTLFGADGQEWAARFDAATGTERWRTRIDRNRRDSQGGGPRATPVVEGERLFVLGAQAKLAALDRTSGEVMWHIDLRRELGAEVPEWGVASSPLVENGLLVAEVAGRKGAYAVAFDTETGAIRWQSGTGSAGYGSAIAATMGDRRQLVFHTVERLLALDPEDGRELWQLRWGERHRINATSPVFVPNNGIFLSSEHAPGTALLQIVPQEDDGPGGGALAFDLVPVWHQPRLLAHLSTHVLVGRHLCGFEKSGLSCIDALTGERVWRSRGSFSEGSLIYADGHLLVLGGRGTLGLVRATPDGYRLASEARVLEGRTWTGPALADGILYLRSPEQLVALRVGADPTTVGGDGGASSLDALDAFRDADSR